MENPQPICIKKKAYTSQNFRLSKLTTDSVTKMSFLDTARLVSKFTTEGYSLLNPIG